MNAFCLAGNLIQRHKEVFMKNPLFVGMRLPEVRNVEPLEKRFPRLTGLSIKVMKVRQSNSCIS